MRQSLQAIKKLQVKQTGARRKRSKKKGGEKLKKVGGKCGLTNCLGKKV